MENGKLFTTERTEREGEGERNKFSTFRVESFFFHLSFSRFYCIPLMWMPSGEGRGTRGRGVSLAYICVNLKR